MKINIYNPAIKVGTNVKLIRQSKLIKQTIPAKQLGISSVALSNIENNKADITVSRLFQIALALGVKPVLLLSENLVMGE